MKIVLKPLHALAHTNFNKQVPREEALKKDCGTLFERELKLRLTRENLINIGCRGEQSSGKSLVGYTIVKLINALMGIQTSVHHIAADQIAFLDKVRDTSLSNCCLLIDEWNELSTTGYNASTNQAFLTQFNEVQAQRFIHRVACSPEKIIDPTARIILDVLDKETTEKFTRCYVYYILYIEGVRVEQACGYVDIDVSHNITDPVYKAYRKRKFARMDMLLEKRIIDNRKGDESEIILAVIKKLMRTVKSGDILNKDIIRSKINKAQKKFTAISIWGEEKLTSEIYSTLLYLKNINFLTHKINKKKKALEKSEDPLYTQTLRTQLKDLEDIRADFQKDFQDDISFHQDIIDTIQHFEDITEETQ